MKAIIVDKMETDSMNDRTINNKVFHTLKVLITYQC